MYRLGMCLGVFGEVLDMVMLVLVYSIVLFLLFYDFMVDLFLFEFEVVEFYGFYSNLVLKFVLELGGVVKIFDFCIGIGSIF